MDFLQPVTDDLKMSHPKKRAKSYCTRHETSEYGNASNESGD
jgi:hypothetical protein